jgi:retron-type reverse transcriptase
LDALAVGLRRKKVNWILDLDVRGFFDNVSHEWLEKFVEHRIADRRILRLIQKWLKAGVSEEGEWTETKVGTPQGAVVSPLLANIYLHYGFDLWVNQWRRSVVQGYFNYHAVPGNFEALQTFRREVARAWLEALRRRSQRRRLPWERYSQIVDRFLPLPRILHPEPGVQFDAKHPR